MNATSWTVFFMFKPYTTIHTTILTKESDAAENTLIELAKQKIHEEIGVSIDELANSLGVNDNFGAGWIIVDMNDYSATEKELELLKIHNIN